MKSVIEAVLFGAAGGFFAMGVITSIRAFVRAIRRKDGGAAPTEVVVPCAMCGAMRATKSPLGMTFEVCDVCMAATNASDGKIPGLSLESINLFRSHHGSRYDRNPTCSDSKLTGGYVPGSNQLPRCPRCTLLIALRDGELPASLSIETAFQGNGGD